MSKYKVGDEFIVKIKEVIDSYNGTLYRSNFSTLVFDDYGLDNLDNVATSANIAVDKAKAYQKGLNDAWELVRKLADMPFQERADIFGYCCDGIVVPDILRDFTPQEALDKIEVYEKEQEKIKVGDVVISGNTEAVVLQVYKWNDYIKLNLISRDGIVEHDEYSHDWKKTGKHIDISSILEQIRGNE